MVLRRVVLFIICLVFGGAVGVVGSHVTGSQWWYLAIPGTIAVGWLMVANPQRCVTRARQGRSGGGGAA
jgi:hypothetical protein